MAAKIIYLNTVVSPYDKTCCEEAGRELHTCPFKKEIEEDHETLCSCCEICEETCRMDI